MLFQAVLHSSICFLKYFGTRYHSTGAYLSGHPLQLHVSGFPDA